MATEHAATEQTDGLISVGDLVQMFENAEEATVDARALSERDRDYYDNKQLTAEELATLKKRGQPPTIVNRISRKVDFLVGLEKSQRVGPRALPRTPMHEHDAQAATDALRYVADDQNYSAKRSALWRNLLIEGAGAIEVAVVPGYDGPQIEIRRWAWDRIFADPHSCELDYSDANYLGGVVWMDEADARIKYADVPDLDAILTDTYNASRIGDTYDDRPMWKVWSDTTRKRVRIVQIWLKRGEDWYFAEYTYGGILKAGPSPYRDDKGKSACWMIFQAAKRNRDNEVYGVVREMIPIQDEINKRRSKALHALNTSQIVMEDGAVKDVEKTRTQAARPDGVVVINPGYSDRFRFETRTDLAAGHVQLLQEAKNEIDMMAGNVALQGDALSKTAASGKAIIASQQGGMMELGDLLDNLRHVDVRVFRAIWCCIRQFWTAEKWIRVTDDERNVKWVGINIDPMQLEMAAAQNPEMAEKIAGVVRNVAELDCDIIIDDAPDSLTPALEQFQALVELKKFDANNELPYRALVEAAPNLRNKDKILAAMDQGSQPNPMQQMAQELQMRGAVAEVQETEASAAEKQAKAFKTAQEAQLMPLQMAEQARQAEMNAAMRAQSQSQYRAA